MNVGAEIGRDELLTLIPHSGTMCLLDRVIAHSEQEIWCVTLAHIRPDNPLRRDGQLSAVHMVEFAAQAMAAHGALAAGAVQRGMLASVRHIRLHAGRIDDIATELTVNAVRRIAQGTGSLYDFSVRSGDRLLGEGRIAIAFV